MSLVVLDRQVTGLLELGQVVMGQVGLALEVTGLGAPERVDMPPEALGQLEDTVQVALERLAVLEQVDTALVGQAPVDTAPGALEGAKDPVLDIQVGRGLATPVPVLGLAGRGLAAPVGRSDQTRETPVLRPRYPPLTALRNLRPRPLGALDPGLPRQR